MDNMKLGSPEDKHSPNVTPGDISRLRVIIAHLRGCDCCDNAILEASDNNALKDEDKDTEAGIKPATDRTHQHRSHPVSPPNEKKDDNSCNELHRRQT